MNKSKFAKIVIVTTLFILSTLGSTIANASSQNASRNASKNGVACDSSQSTKANSGKSRAQTCSYTISLDANGGYVSQTSFEYKIGASPLWLPTPERSNFNFDGWFTSSLGGIQINLPYTPTSSITLYAQWSESTPTYRVGDVGPGGGIVYFVGNVNFTMVGAPCADQCRYLEVAPKNWSGTGSEPFLPFALPEFQNQYVAATGIAIGTGLTNTNAIVAQNGVCTDIATCGYAAGAAKAYNGGGFTDWFLPSREESSRLATVPLASYPIFYSVELGLQRIGDAYWNSWAGNPEAPGAATNTVFFASPVPGDNNGLAGGYKGKDSLYYVRPVRAF